MKRTLIIILFFIVTTLTALLYSCNMREHNTHLKIGNQYQGGLVAYILRPGDYGYDENVPHGLIAAPFDIGKERWGCKGLRIESTSAQIMSGSINTENIVRKCFNEYNAAKSCSDLELNGYIDWYLPSIAELETLYQNLHSKGLGNFKNHTYWTSTEEDDEFAWYYDMENGYSDLTFYYKDFEGYVRPVRSF